jgi:hypothetical protein
MSSSLYGIAVRDEGGFHLLARVARRPTGIYYLIQRANEDFDIVADKPWDPHASYHSDGRRHFKSFDEYALSREKRQPLDSFTGAESLFMQTFQPGDLTDLPEFNGKSAFTGTFEIPGAQISRTETYVISVTLLAPGSEPLPGPWVTTVLQHCFRDAIPWIHITFGRGLVGVAAQ